MNRVAPLDAPYEASVAESLRRAMPEGMEPLKLFRTLAHNPRVLQRMFAGNLLDEGSIDLRDRELIILRTCARCGAEYEWGVHLAIFAKRAKLGDGEIRATVTRDLQPNVLPHHVALLFQAVDELHDTSTISDKLWTELTAHYSAAQILEIIALTGSYHMIAFIANAAGVELEEFAPRFQTYL